MTTVTRGLTIDVALQKWRFGVLFSVLMKVVMQLPGIRPEEYGVCTGNDCLAVKEAGGQKEREFPVLRFVLLRVHDEMISMLSSRLTDADWLK